MDVCALDRFHRSVTRLPPDLAGVPPGGLRHFLQHDLRPKIFLVSLAVFEDRWATKCVPHLTAEELGSIRCCMRIIVDHVVRIVSASVGPCLKKYFGQYHAARLRQNELRANFSRLNTPSEASWMFYLLLALLRCVGFDGDTLAASVGASGLELAVAQAEFFFARCAESFALRQRVDQSGVLEYEEYDPHHAIPSYFSVRRDLSTFCLIPTLARVAPVFDLTPNPSAWTETEHIIEACVIAMSRIEGTIGVERSVAGDVIRVSRESIGIIMADMVRKPGTGSAADDMFHAETPPRSLSRYAVRMVKRSIIPYGSSGPVPVISIPILIVIVIVPYAGYCADADVNFPYNRPWDISRLVRCTEPFSTPNPDFPISESSPLHMNRYLLATIRPFVYFVQGAVDPAFKGDAPYAPMAGEELASIRRILIHLADDLRLLLFGAFSVSSVETLPSDIQIAGFASNMFRILASIVQWYGLDAKNTTPSDAHQILSQILDLYVSSSSQAAKPIPFPSMALRFALLKDLPRAAPPAYHARTLYEVFYVDLPDDESLVRYLRRSDVASYCETVLSPLRDVVMLVRDRFYLSQPRPRDTPWLRRNLVVYLQLLRHVCEALGPSPTGAQKGPTPTVACLLYMQRLVERFGFVDDHLDSLCATYTRSSAVVFEHARHAELGASGPSQHRSVADDFSFFFETGTPYGSSLAGHCASLPEAPPSYSEADSEDEEFFIEAGTGYPVSFATAAASDVSDFPVSVPSSAYKTEGFERVRSSPSLPSMVDYAPPRSVAQLARVPQAVRLMLGVYLLNVPDIRSFSSHPDPVLAYFSAVVGPYSLLIDKAIPGRARESKDVPADTKAFLLPHVNNFVKFLVLAYLVAQRVSIERGSPLSFPPESCATLGLARKFHTLLDQPSYEFPDGVEPDILLLLNFMSEFADRAAGSGSRPRDIPEVRGLEHIPCVPSWTTEDIRILQSQEPYTPWVGESYWLADRTQALLRVGRDLGQALNNPAHAAWYPAPPKDVDGIAPSAPFLVLE
ncbi:hypothetical protein DFH06DRAFT_1125846 [Mycena polygramma]|nr:hypothetical protein DFH06DRAFT_1125846 [Mycena polygramma]